MRIARGSELPPGGSQQEPFCYSEGKIASSEANGAPRTCESRIWPTRTKNMLLSEQSLMENLVDGAHDVYYNDVDNGDVPGLVSTAERPRFEPNPCKTLTTNKLRG